MVTSLDVEIGPNRLTGALAIPAETRGLVIFAHGSGSGRQSPRNIHVAERLQARGMATLLFDLLTAAESGDRANTFNIALLAERVGHGVIWARAHANLSGLPIGLFGASTGAGAAIVAASERPDDVSAVVSRGGRPDLAGPALDRILAPTLLIVGGLDHEVLALNVAARRRMRCASELAVVPGAGHLFSEHGTLDQVIRLAGGWFAAHLPGAAHGHRSVS
jgi:putative phosphoribosyl transferase